MPLSDIIAQDGSFGYPSVKKYRRYFMKFSTKFIARSAIIAAIYFALSMLLQPLTYGPMQFRVAEALTMLPFLMTEGVYGVIIGCFLTNLFSGYVVYDVIFGTLATAIAAVLTRIIKNKWLAGLPPVAVNALILPLIWLLAGSTEESYAVNALSITVSQAVIVYAIGIPMVILIRKRLPELGKTRPENVSDAPEPESGENENRPSE